MSALYLLNFVLLQWFFVRIARIVRLRDGRTVGWTVVKCWPLTGWWSPYVYWGKPPQGT